MKKSPLPILSLLLAVPMIFYFSCQKQTPNSPPANVAAINKVNTWLDGQGSSFDDDTKASIALLKKNLELAKLTFEKLNDSEQFVIIPINSRFSVKGINNVANPINTLLLILDPGGEIRKGQIVQYQPEQGVAVNKVPDNTFFNIFHHGTLESDGVFQFYNPQQRLQYVFTYKNGLMSSYGLVKPQEKTKQVANAPVTNPGCLDWYLETVDNNTGEVLSVVYLYTTCDGSETGGGGGGGGGGDETGLTTQVSWIVKNEQGIYYVTSYENIQGVKVHSEPGGGHFTSISHLNSSVFNTSGISNLHVSYQELAVTVSLFSVSRADATVSGKITYDSGNLPDAPANGSKAWIFPDVFP